MAFFGQIVSTFNNRNYLVILVGYFFFMIASGIYDTLKFTSIPDWELKPNQIRWFSLVGLAPQLPVRFCHRCVCRLFDRKPVMLISLTITTLCAQLVVTLRLFGLMPENGDPCYYPCCY